MVVKAPWTAEQVDALNRSQRAGFTHPFTCMGHEGVGDRDLVATRKGWVCCHCDYTQDWAHEFMLKEPVNPIADMRTDALVAKIINQIEGQNWTDCPLSESEKIVIDMAIRATADQMTPALRPSTAPTGQ